MLLFPAAHSFLRPVFVLLLNVVSFSLWRRDDMVVGDSGPLVSLSSLSLLLLLLLHFSKALRSELVQPVCLIAFHFQEASLLAQTQRFIHQMSGVRLKLRLWYFIWGKNSALHFHKNKPLAQNCLMPTCSLI